MFILTHHSNSKVIVQIINKNLQKRIFIKYSKFIVVFPN